VGVKGAVGTEALYDPTGAPIPEGTEGTTVTKALKGPTCVSITEGTAESLSALP
jgi:hypothetical protein